MSDHRAIGGVSLTLKALLEDRMDLTGPALPANERVTVTVSAPDVRHDNVTGPRLNLFLYHVTENGYLKNQEIPGHGIPGAYGHPPLSLDLHYLLTAYGTSETDDVLPHHILGDAMRVLHDFPIITDALQRERTPSNPPIVDTPLLGAFERIKIVLQPASVEDLSRIWTALPEANFRLSAAYQVTVVQIESQAPRRLPLPVRTRRVHVSVLRRPQLSAAYRTPAPGGPVGDARLSVLQELTLEGLNFLAPRTWVRLGSLEPIGVTPVSDAVIRVIVPDDTYPADPDHPLPRPIPPGTRLQPGVQLVEVLIRTRGEVVQGGLDRGEVVASDVLQGSNQLAFIVVPQIAAVAPPSGASGTVIAITGRRLFHETRPSQILIGDLPFAPLDPADPASPPGTIRTPEEVRVRVSGLAPGIYRVRAFVNGAESIEEDQTFEVVAGP